MRARGVDFEQAIPDEYLARLADAYARFFYQYDEAPLLIINSERLNFVRQSRRTSSCCCPASRGMRGRREFFNLGQA